MWSLNLGGAVTTAGASRVPVSDDEDMVVHVHPFNNSSRCRPGPRPSHAQPCLPVEVVNATGRA